MASVLKRVNSSEDIKALKYAELRTLAREIRQLMIKTVSQTGGHLASSLGVVELTIALHRVFNTPDDKIVWDVGHQCYPHKLLTGRKDKFGTLRQHNGLSGFPVRDESPHDAFGAGHAGTSISAALGMAVARDLAGGKNHVIAVIGDGSLGAGMAFEALNHAGQVGSRLIVILNDNGMSISPSVGAISQWLNQVRFDPKYEFIKKEAKKRIQSLPFGKTAWNLTRQVKKQFETVVLPGAFWENFGFTYLGPINGHNIKEVEGALARARDFTGGPVLLHVLTKKGKGYTAAEDNATKFHGVSPVTVKTSSAPTYNRVLGNAVGRLMYEDDRIVAITAAMLEGTGLAPVAAEFPNRVFDVGICEQHAVTLAAGLATQGFVPIVAIYSTFMQRAYDQIIHDVCLQNLPVVFAIDRAGIVGDDGKTHQGAFDVSYLRAIPNIIISAPGDENELQHLLYTAVNCGRPMAMRYPRGNGTGAALETDLRFLPIGKGEVVRTGEDLAILAFGPSVNNAVTAAGTLAEAGIEAAVANMRFAKPLDAGLVEELATGTGRLITVEENAVSGGFGSAVLELIQSMGLPDVRVECLGLPDRFIEHGTQEQFRAAFDLDADGIVRRANLAFPELAIKASYRNRR